MGSVLGMNAFDVRPEVDAFSSENLVNDGIMAEVQNEIYDVHGDGGVFEDALGSLHVVFTPKVEKFLKPTVYE